MRLILPNTNNVGSVIKPGKAFFSSVNARKVVTRSYLGVNVGVDIYNVVSDKIGIIARSMHDFGEKGSDFFGNDKLFLRLMDKGVTEDLNINFYDMESDNIKKNDGVVSLYHIVTHYGKHIKNSGLYRINPANNLDFNWESVINGICYLGCNGTVADTILYFPRISSNSIYIGNNITKMLTYNRFQYVSSMIYDVDDGLLGISRKYILTNDGYLRHKENIRIHYAIAPMYDSYWGQGISFNRSNSYVQIERFKKNADMCELEHETYGDGRSNQFDFFPGDIKDYFFGFSYKPVRPGELELPDFDVESILNGDVWFVGIEVFERSLNYYINVYEKICNPCIENNLIEIDNILGGV